MVILFFSLYSLIASDASSGATKGDVNEDGVTDMVDALLVAREAGGVGKKAINEEAGDINGNGEIDEEDSSYIARFALGLISSLTDIEGGSAAANLAANPGFEVGTEGWFNFGPSCVLTVSSDKVRSGDFSGYITDRTEPWNGPALDLSSIMKDGGEYKLSVWAQLDNAKSSMLKLTVKKVDGNGAEYTNIGAGKATNTEWTKIGGSYMCSISGELQELVMYVEDAPPGVNFYVDDAEVSEM